MSSSTPPSGACHGRIDFGGEPSDDHPLLTRLVVPVVLAQAIVERGLLDTISSGLGRAKYHIEVYAGQGNAIYVVIGAVLLLVLTRVNRRR